MRRALPAARPGPAAAPAGGPPGAAPGADLDRVRDPDGRAARLTRSGVGPGVENKRLAKSV